MVNEQYDAEFHEGIRNSTLRLVYRRRALNMVIKLKFLIFFDQVKKILQVFQEFFEGERVVVRYALVLWNYDDSSLLGDGAFFFFFFFFQLFLCVRKLVARAKTVCCLL